jgi:hypothetical protein
MADVNKCLIDHSTGEIRELIAESIQDYETLRNAGKIKGDVDLEKYLTDKFQLLNDERKKAVILNNEAYQKLNSKLDFAQEQYKAAGKKPPSKYKILQDVLMSNSKAFNEAGLSLETMTTGYQSKWLGKLMGELEKIPEYKDNITGHAGINMRNPVQKKLNDNIARERARLSGNDNVPPTNDPLAVKYAITLHKIEEELLQEMQRRGFNIQKRIGYAGMQTHNRSKLRQVGFDEWYRFIKDNVDLKKMKFLTKETIAKEIFDNLAGGKAFDPKIIPLSMREGFDNFNYERAIAFSNIESEIKYKNLFGSSKSQIEETFSKVNNLARDIITRSQFGTNPKAVLEKTLSGITREGGLKPSEQPSKILDIFDSLQGNVMVGNEAVAISASNLRRLVSTTIFGKVAVTTSASDRINMALKQWQRDGNFGGLLFNSITAIPMGIADIGTYLWKGISFGKKGGLTAKERAWVREQGLISNGIVAGVRRNMDDIYAYGTGSGLSRILDGIEKVFGKVSFLETKQNIDDKADFTRFAAEFATTLKKGNYNNLNAFQKESLSRFGIGKEEYDVLRQIKVDKDPLVGKAIFSPNHVADLTDAQLKPLISKYKTTIDEVRFNLENKIRSMYVNQSVTQRGYRTERARFFVRGTKAGTSVGEAARFFSQAKSYPLMYWDNIINSTFDNLSAKTNEKWAAFVTFAGASIVAAYMVEQTNEILNGKQPKELDGELMVRALARSGVLGLWGDFGNASLSQVFDVSKSTGYSTQANYYKELMSFAAGPTGSRVLDFGEAISNIISQNPDPDKFLKTVKNTIPGNNIFYVNGFLNYTVAEMSEAMGGKGKQKANRNMTKANNAWGERREFLPPFNYLYEK